MPNGSLLYFHSEPGEHLNLGEQKVLVARVVNQLSIVIS